MSIKEPWPYELLEQLKRMNDLTPMPYRRMRCRTCGQVIESPVFNCIGSACDLVNEPEGTTP